ncbi:neuropeptide Y receptor type 1-like [Corticium candelabrum]|uniref:neuropeptide Y receptor type 1-like n=1 Tax=Corticium candelabrum TaxID=121492 RepID=UPI002E25C821|nr:neuropeptide Y receptor type 1-like [Corticium candelabrum]
MMNISENGSHPRLQGVTSVSFHVSVWTLSLLGIIGNTLVIIWRCSRRKESRFHLVSLLIVNLAFSDILFCTQFVLREVMLVRPIFNHCDNVSYPFTETDSTMCITSFFLVCLSCNCIVLATVAIALHTFLSVDERRWTKPIVVTVVAAGWIFSLIFSSVASQQLAKDLNVYYMIPDKSAKIFSLIVVYRCFGDRRRLFPVIITLLTVISSMICCFLYIGFCIKFRRLSNRLGGNEMRERHARSFIALQIRFAFVVVLNLACWVPACALYWDSYFNNRTVFKGNFDPKVPEPAFLIAIIVSAANPIIYTMSCDPCIKLLKWLFNFTRHSENEQRQLLLH